MKPLSLLVFGLALASTAMPARAGPAVDAVRSAIERIMTSDHFLHAVIAIDPSALAQAHVLDATEEQPTLHGLPILIKDNIDTAGLLPTTAGSLALAANVSAHDASLVTRLRAAGAVILGKTNLSEWADFRSVTPVSGWSAVGGQTRNPFDLDRSPCGSSSGSAVAIAAGYVDAAVGTETNGSITCPASFNGIVGLKPTVGLISRSGIIPISESFDTAGPLAKDVRTTARLLAAMAGSDAADAATMQADARRADYVGSLHADALRGARLGILPLSPTWSASVRALFTASIAKLRAAGAILIETPWPSVADIYPNLDIVASSEFKVGINAYLAATPKAVKTRSLADLIVFNTAHGRTEMRLFGQERFVEAQATKGLDVEAYRQALAKLRRQTRQEGIDALLATYDVDALISPTMPPAPVIDTVTGDVFPVQGPGTLAAIAGYPHLSVPMGQVAGLPVGLSFVGPAWSERRLLALGFAFEQARGILPEPTQRK